MQTDYQAAMAEQQAREEQRYQQTRDPFEYGRQVAQRRYSEIMSDLDRQRAQTAQSYSDLYSAARQQAVRGQAAGGPTLSGGMGQQQRDYISSIEMQELGRIGTAREGAMRDLYTQAQSAMSNAQLEGQQATQMQLQNQQTQLELVKQRQAILADDTLTQEQRAQQLDALGIDYSQEDVGGANNGFVGVIGGAAALAGAFNLATKGVFGTKIGVAALDLSAKLAPTLKAGGILSKMGVFGKALGLAGKAVPWLAMAWGAEKVIELIQGKGAEGGLIGSEGLIRLGNFNI